MGFFKIIKRLIGGLNLDSTTDDLPSTDYVSGYDVVDRNPSKSSEDKYLQPENNNELAYDLGEIENCVKFYKISIDITNIIEENCIITMTVYLKYGYSWNMQFYYTAGDSADDLYNNILTTITSYITGDPVGFNQGSGNTLVFDFNLFSFFRATDFFVSFSDDATTSANYTVIATKDAISSEKIGALVPIEFTNINSAQQVWATTKSKEPVTIVVDGADISNVFVLTFTEPNYLLDGEEIYMYGNGVGLYVCVQATSNPYEYNVWGSTNPVTGGCIFVNGLYTIVKNKRTASVIGYATKNYLEDDWTYTELIRSINLNFRTYNQIQAYGMITNNGTIYNWTDYLNQIKRLYYFGNITTGGFLTINNSNAIYDLDTIGQESNLQLGTNTAKVFTDVSVGTGGGRTSYTKGSKTESCYVAFARFKTNDGYYSTFSKASNVTWLHNTNLYEHKYGSNSNRALRIAVTQIEYKLFEYVQIGIIEFTPDSYKGYLLPEILINNSDSISIVDTGFEAESYADFNDAGTLLEQIAFVFENAKSILPYNLYEIAANVNLIKDRNLTEWAKEITLTVKSRYDVYTSNDYAQYGYNWLTQGINAYNRCTTFYTSYMPLDTYRFCIFIDWVDGSPTSTYWIDDVAFPINVTTNDSQPVNVYQYYLEASNINLDYVLPNGEYLRDIVKDISFGRALCNNQVIATGAYILSSDKYGAYHVTDAYWSGTPDTDIQLNRLTFYSPDLINTSNSISFQSGDTVWAFENLLQNSYNITGSNYALDYYGNISGAAVSSGVAELQNLETGAVSSITNLIKSTGGSTVVQNRGGAVMSLSSNLNNITNRGFGSLYYVRQYPSSGAYPESPSQTRFFVIPMGSLFNKKTHTTATAYNLYGGDCFQQKSFYKAAENNTSPSIVQNNMIGFYSFNRTNSQLRSGAFPYYGVSNYLISPFLKDSASPHYNDVYTYYQSFTPRYPFQNQLGFNPDAKQITKLGTSIFYSEQSISYDLAGGNRLWLPLNRKDLEATYGDIIHMEILLGFSETGLLIVWQPQRTTAQYFDNTANIRSSSGELLIGNGEIMARKGADFTEYGCEHKWTIRKGQNPTGKDVAFWACFRKGAIMRLGADGTADLVGDINSLLTNKTFLALQNEYNNLDTPAHNYGCHAVWNNQTKEYILTLTLVPKALLYVQGRGGFNIGQWVYSSETWGFENIPVMYKSLVDGNDYPVSDRRYWESYSGYDNDVFQIWTLVWNEIDNKFKTFRTFNPKIYGQFNNTYVSSHPNYPNLIYEHNKNKNEALFYCTQSELRITATTNPELYRIEGAGIESILPIPFAPSERTKWVVKIEEKNFEIVGSGVDYLQMANVDNDDILPEYTFDGQFYYYICNCQDPYIEGVVNESKPRYVQFVLKNTQADDTLKRTQYYAGYDSLGTVTTQSFTNKPEEEFYNGESNVQIKMDTTNSPTNNEIGENAVEGKWARVKQFWRWGKKNRVLTTSVAIEETEYKKR